MAYVRKIIFDKSCTIFNNNNEIKQLQKGLTLVLTQIITFTFEHEIQQFTIIDINMKVTLLISLTFKH